jgi:plastocyanin
VEIEMVGMGFKPDVVTLSVGDTVVWTNHDIVPHTATGTGFDTGTLAPSASGRFVAGHADTLDYTCGFHPTMKGRLIVL